MAILDIDEVIQLIRSSDNAAAAKERLIAVFDLSEVQADYILDMPLRRLTRFSRLELEKEKSELQATIEELDAILADEVRLRGVVSDELAEVAKTFGTPRRTVLLESAGTAAVTAAVPLEVADDPCFVYLSSSGLLARTTTDEPPGSGGGRAKHDVIVSAVPATARGEVGAAHQRRPRRPPRGAGAARAAPRRPTTPTSPAPTRCRSSWSSSRVSGCWPSARCGPTVPGWRSAPGRAWSSGSTPRSSPSPTGR